MNKHEKRLLDAVPAEDRRATVNQLKHDKDYCCNSEGRAQIQHDIDQMNQYWNLN